MYLKQAGFINPAATRHMGFPGGLALSHSDAPASGHILPTSHTAYPDGSVSVAVGFTVPILRYRNLVALLWFLIGWAPRPGSLKVPGGLFPPGPCIH